MTNETGLAPTAAYLEYLRQGRFMLQYSRASGRFVFYPRVLEPGTGVTDLEWVEASGRGTVYSVTVQRARPPAPDTNLVLVDLEEGPRMLGRVEGVAPDAVTIGMAVRARIVVGEGDPFVVFEPVKDGA